MLIYNKKTDNVEDITLTTGFYTFIYKLDELPKQFKTQKLPKIITIVGKRGVLNSVELNEVAKEITVKIWIAENPIPLILLVYVIGGALISWGLALTTGNLTSIVKDVFNPFTLIIIAVIVITIFGIPKLQSRKS